MADGRRLSAISIMRRRKRDATGHIILQILQIICRGSINCLSSIFHRFCHLTTRPGAVWTGARSNHTAIIAIRASPSSQLLRVICKALEQEMRLLYCSWLEDALQGTCTLMPIVKGHPPPPQTDIVMTERGFPV